MYLQFIVQNLRQKMNCDYINTTLMIIIENILFFKTFSTLIYVFKPESNFANYKTVGFFFKVLDRRCSWLDIKRSYYSQNMTLRVYIRWKKLNVPCCFLLKLMLKFLKQLHIKWTLCYIVNIFLKKNSITPTSQSINRCLNFIWV